MIGFSRLGEGVDKGSAESRVGGPRALSFQRAERVMVVKLMVIAIVAQSLNGGGASEPAASSDGAGRRLAADARNLLLLKPPARAPP